MNTGSIPRHTRGEFIKSINSESLATCLSKPSVDPEIIDFSPSSDNCRGDAMRRPVSDPFLGRRMASPLQLSTQSQLPSPPSSPPIAPPPPRPNPIKKKPAQLVHTELLPGGKRQETFDNGSILSKDALGRVVEVYSNSGECLFLSYDDSGELSSFNRVDAHGTLHSTATKGRHSVTVRDTDGRAKAIGECMTIDHAGRFFLHTRDGQFFCLDLISNIHCERRRVMRQDGTVSYVTAAFAHDGFRMATAYARNTRSSARRRDITYRFYGRDGSVVEFASEEEFRDLKPTNSMPPCTIPVHKTWRQCRQAHTAWESVNEYLCRVN